MPLSTFPLRRRRENVWSWPLHEFNDNRVWTFYQRCLARSAAKQVNAAQNLHARGLQTRDGRCKIRHRQGEMVDDVPGRRNQRPGPLAWVDYEADVVKTHGRRWRADDGQRLARGAVRRLAWTLTRGCPAGGAQV